MDFERMWHDLLPLGRSTRSGGYFRQPFGAAERECAAWFEEECGRRGLAVEYDSFGNAIAWWRPEGVAGPGVLTGSHLDSVLNGGAFDGPLGVVSALAALDLLRERGVTPTRPLGIGVFVEEEGSRFGLACLGSRLATGAISFDAARDLRDRDGVTFADALAGTGLAPEPGMALPGTGTGTGAVGAFVELHVEQGRDLGLRDRAVGVASAIWPHGRYRFEFAGEANHAGTTRMEDRHDPMLTCAMTVLAANKQARVSTGSAAGARATFGRIEVEPNGTNAVPSKVTAWLDARCAGEGELEQLVTTIARLGRERADRDGTSLTMTPESVSPAVAFDPALAARLASLLGDAPIIPTQAGHDAGILSSAGIPTAMLFVRNPTGVSHSPEEYAETADCLEGVTALADVLEELTR